jgi:hypothetical protein
MYASLNSAPLLVLILVIDLAFTSFHSYQEWKGVGAPLWRNFGAIVGLDIPDWLGFLFFTVVLTLVLFVVGFAGILGQLNPQLYPNWTTGALAALIGARLSDTLVSHIIPHTVGYRPNPGLSSTSLYALEAVFLGWFFHAPLADLPLSALRGFAAGALLFVLVFPVLRLTRWVWPTRKRPSWSRWQPIPSWASTNI